MFGRRREPDHSAYGTDVVERPIRARGGVSLASILTGALVAIGAFFLLSSVVGAILTQTGVSAEELSSGEAVDAGIAGGIALLVAWFLSFLWGGYTAGRMARGAGFVNGLLVPVGVVLLGAIVGLIAWAFGASEGFNLPSPTEQLQVEGQYTSVEYGLALGAITLGVMFLGGILGGLVGQRWHTKLERRTENERHEELVGRRTEETKQVDLREREQQADREHAAAYAQARESAQQERAQASGHPAGTGTGSPAAPPAGSAGQPGESGGPYNPPAQGSQQNDGNPSTRT